MVIAGDQLLWLEDDSEIPSRIMTCALSGCPEGARELASGAVSSLAADSQTAFWVDYNDGVHIASWQLSSGAEPQLHTAPDAVSAWYQTNSSTTEYYVAQHPPIQLATTSDPQSPLYLSDGKTVARLPKDCSGDAQPFCSTVVGYHDFVATGDRVYSATGGLVGSIQYCVDEANATGTTELVHGLRWPFDLIADQAQAYWAAYVAANVVDDLAPSVYADVATAPVDIESIALDASASVTPIVNNVQRLGPCPLAMNAHHLYWCEVPSSDPLMSSLRMIHR